VECTIVKQDCLALAVGERRVHFGQMRAGVAHHRVLEEHRSARDVHPAIAPHDVTLAGCLSINEPVVVDPAARQFACGDAGDADARGDA